VVNLFITDLQEISNALSNCTIADPLRLSLSTK